jgi:hypothetical protein
MPAEFKRKVMTAQKESKYNIEHRAGDPPLLVVYCRRNLDVVFSREIVRVLKGALAEPAAAANLQLVIDLANQFEIGPVFLREVAPILKSLKEQGRKLYIVQAPKAVVYYLNQSGMRGSIEVLDSLPSPIKACS